MFCLFDKFCNKSSLVKCSFLVPCIKKKLCLVYIFKSDKKMASKNNKTKDDNKLFFIFQCYVFRFLITYIYHFISPNTQGLVFSANYIFAYLPSSEISGDPIRAFDQFMLFWPNLSYRKDSNIYLIKKNYHHH